VVTKPFGFEGPRRMKQAERGLADLAATVDTVIAIPNDKILEIVPRGTSFYESFRVADDVLRQAVQGSSDIITTPGVINRDFSDIRAIMLGMGYAMMGTATAKGENAAVEAAKQAINCPLLDDGGVKGARGILINISGSSKLSIHDVNEACALIRAAAEYDDVQINFGIVLNEAMNDEVKITVLATGFQRSNLPAIDRGTNVQEGRMISGPPPRQQQIAQDNPPIFSRHEDEPYAEREAEVENGEAIATTATIVSKEEEQPKNDLDMPAFLRRERRLFQ
jgi:cell division protein FtsZ